MLNLGKNICVDVIKNPSLFKIYYILSVKRYTLYHCIYVHILGFCGEGGGGGESCGLDPPNEI